jgi:hypothetical protein
MVKIVDNQTNINILWQKTRPMMAQSASNSDTNGTAFTEGSVGKNLLKLIFW